jgi:hypothetical protein
MASSSTDLPGDETLMEKEIIPQKVEASMD